jgi:Holliday junction resolvase RusA-like endonuclease
MTEISIRLDGPPRGKGRPRFRRIRAKDGREFVSAYTDGKTVSYEDALKAQAKIAMAGQPPLLGALWVGVTAAMPVPASWSKKKRMAAVSGCLHPVVKPDHDNIMKLLDALNLIVWKDDCQIIESQIRKFYAEKPYLLVVVRPLESASCQTVPAVAAESRSRKSASTERQLPLGGPPPSSTCDPSLPRSLSG